MKVTRLNRKGFKEPKESLSAVYGDRLYFKSLFLKLSKKKFILPKSLIPDEAIGNRNFQEHIFGHK